MAIHIDPPTAEGNTLTTQVSPTGATARFFSGAPLEVQYDVDVGAVPESILVIPALAHVCPVAWATGTDVTVERVDAEFAAAIADVRTAMCDMYDFLEGGEVHAGAVVGAQMSEVDTDRSDVGSDSRDENGPAGVTEAETTGDGPSDRDGNGEGDGDHHRAGLLFTGGVDSTCSYVRHREEAPTLISIRGWTISPSARDDDHWHHLLERTNTFAAECGLETAFVESNMLSFLDHPMLLAHFKRHVDGGWYSSVGHGLGLLGLCAPMARARGLDDLYIAATHWEGIDLEWGSRPDIDDAVRWRGTRCHHDAYDLTRQERLDVIAEYVRTTAPNLELQTCNVRMDGNCGTCEKCYRTAVGLRLSGLDPVSHGYEFVDGDYDEIRAALESGRWILGEDEYHMWADIRERARETDPRSTAEAEFFSWLETADLASLVDSSRSPLHHRLLRAGARHTPHALYARLYPAWAVAKAGYRRLTPSR